MTALSIIELPDERLRSVSSPVEQFDSQLASLVVDLRDTLAKEGGIGISAPQLGVLSQVVLINVPDDGLGEIVYVNPQILARSSWGFVQESCLSVPGISGLVFRATNITVSAYDALGNPFETQVTGMHAVCLQHEIDHLEGTLFVDRLSWFKKLRLRLEGKAF
jgi:peptide deformylase